MTLARWYETYANCKWEFLRRNSDYQEDYDRRSASFLIPGHSFDDYLYCAAWNLSDEVEEEREAFRNKWKLRFPINYKYSYDEIPDYNVKWHIWYWARGDDPLKEMHDPVEVAGEYGFLMDLLVDSLSWKEKGFGPDGTEDDWNRFIEQYKLGTELTLNIDLEYDRKVIMEGVENWLKFIEIGKRFIRPDKPAPRERQTFDKYPSYLKVWDMRQKGLPFPEIAREVFPDDFKDPSELEEDDPDPNPESALVKVQQYYKEAERLIMSGI